MHQIILAANHYFAFVLETNGQVCCAITEDLMVIVVLRKLKTPRVVARNWSLSRALDCGVNFENEFWKWMCVYCLVRRCVIQLQYSFKLNFQTHFQNQLSNPLPNPCSKFAFKTIIQLHFTNSSSPCYGLTEVTNGYPPLSFSSN